jgi:acetyltransferase-like isoleucine patch superfamily enzyme
VLAPIRRLRVAWWLLALRLRLRRHGVRLRVAVGPNLRLAGRPRLDLDPGDGRGGTLTVGIGSDVRVGRDLVLDVRPGLDHVVELGAGVILQDHVRLQVRGGAIRLAEHVQVRDHCELKSGGELTVGARAVIGRGSTLHCEQRVSLGAHVGLAPLVTILDSDHAADGSGKWFLDQPLLVEPVVVEDNVLLGANAVLLRGAVVQANAIVAAGAVVLAGEHPAGSLLGGVPARPLKQLG